MLINLHQKVDDTVNNLAIWYIRREQEKLQKILDKYIETGQQHLEDEINKRSDRVDNMLNLYDSILPEGRHVCNICNIM